MCKEIVAECTPRAVLILGITAALSGCVTVNETSVRGFADQELCSFLGPEWITTGRERAVILQEIEGRRIGCTAQGAVVYNSESEGRPEPIVDAKPAAPAEPRDGGRKQTSGSGILVTADGLAITNQHVVAGCNGISVALGQNVSRAELVTADPRNDLALLRTSLRPERSASLRIGGTMKLGEPVVAAGYPFDGLLGSGLKITTGNVSGLSGLGNDSSMFQFSAPVQPGNSGGPLLDDSGQVLGVVSAKLDELKAAAATGSLPQNVNLAIKTATVFAFLDTAGVSVMRSERQSPVGVEQVAERAAQFVVQIRCDGAGTD